MLTRFENGPRPPLCHPAPAKLQIIKKLYSTMTRNNYNQATKKLIQMLKNIQL